MMHPAHDPAQATRGDVLAEKVASQIGSWRFIIIQSVAVTAWVGINATGLSLHWDLYPFVLLNLMFSVQAAYTGPILLLASNRQAAIDKIRADLDHEHLTINTEMTTQIHAKVVGE